MLRKQGLVLAGMAGAIIVIVLLVANAGVVATWLHIPVPSGDDAASRLALAAQWLVVPGLTLMIGIGMVARQRFFVADAMDGSPNTQNHVLEINLRYNRNTLEQMLLVALAWPTLALALPHDRLALIPELAIVFGVARALFWLGYLYAGWARAFGFALTFYPTVAVYLWLVWKALS